MLRATDRDAKKVYAITAAGKTELEAHREEVKLFYERCEDASGGHDADLREVMHRVRRVLHAFRRAARRGQLTPAVVAQVRATLDGVAAKLEALIDD